MILPTPGNYLIENGEQQVEALSVEVLFEGIVRDDIMRLRLDPESNDVNIHYFKTGSSSRIEVLHVSFYRPQEIKRFLENTKLVPNPWKMFTEMEKKGAPIDSEKLYNALQEYVRKNKTVQVQVLTKDQLERTIRTNYYKQEATVELHRTVSQQITYRKWYWWNDLIM